MRKLLSALVIVLFLAGFAAAGPPVQASDILAISNEHVYGAFKSFNNGYAAEGEAVDALLSDHGLTRPITSGQIQALSNKQKVALIKDIFPIIIQSVALNDFEGELLELGYANIQACIDDLPNMFSGNLLINLTTNFTEAKEARVKLAGLIDNDLILSLVSVLVNVADDIKARHVNVLGV